MKSATLLVLLISGMAFSAPVEQMNRAFNALMDLVPYLTDDNKFMETKNAKVVEKGIAELQTAFKEAGHDSLLKEDLFAPSYTVIHQNLSDSLSSFRKGNKDYSYWRLKEVTSHCLDCHTRLPPSHASSFQNGKVQIDPSKFESVYNLGVAQLIVRRYVDAKASFNRDIQDRLIKKDVEEIDLPFKQLLLIDTKVLKNPVNLIALFKTYQKNEAVPEIQRLLLKSWIEDLEHWKGNKYIVNGIKSDSDVERFIKDELRPLENETLYDGSHDVPLLMTTGILSNYLFENPTSKMAPEISYWMGWTEKYLKREQFFGSGDLFLKQCIKRYPGHAVAKKCLEAYRESVEFEFSGSGGTKLPADIKLELLSLEKLIKKK